MILRTVIVGDAYRGATRACIARASSDLGQRGNTDGLQLASEPASDTAAPENHQRPSIRFGDGRWWFSGRRYQTLARTLAADHAVFPLPEI